MRPAEITAELQEIASLVHSVRPAEAEARCRAVISSLDLSALDRHDAELRATIDLFFKKRRTALATALRDRRGQLNSSSSSSEPDVAATQTSYDSASPTPSSPFPKHSSVGRAAPSTATLQEELADVLANLSNYHIFQWATFYRDRLRPLFEPIIAAERREGNAAAMVLELFSAHSRDIFGKGAAYMAHTGATRATALVKSLSGLQRFLELPIELYAASIAQASDPRTAEALRRVSSAMVAGILDGYADVSLGESDGWQLLPRYPRAWAHYLGFLTRDDLETLLQSIEEGELVAGIERSVVPVASAIDELVRSSDAGASALPILGQFVWDSRRLDIQLRSGTRAADTRFLEIQCYLDAGFTRQAALEEAERRRIALVVAPLRPDVREWLGSQDLLRNVAVDVSSEDEQRAAKRARDILAFAIARQSNSDIDTPLNQNFAERFPLDNPHLTRYFHVHRESVQGLLRSFEQRNGIRLWCSVRRSGKTTACFDLSGVTGAATVVSQTCDSTNQQLGSDIFYNLVIEALESGRQLPRTFVEDAVAQSVLSRTTDVARYVFVLDEYETLFGRLDTAVLSNRELRYTVVQPLLNQMVAFGRENLLILVGQQPDAHFILMDQNQLSAYVRQDSFPLFAHDSADDSEFRDLLRRVMTDRVMADRSFVDALYAETGGHPYLTVKILIEFFDWLIKQRRSVRALQFTQDDFTAFARVRFTSEVLGLSQHYWFFRRGIAQAISPRGLSEMPWLCAVYSVLRGMAIASPETLRVSRRDFAALAAKIPNGPGMLPSGEDLLGTGARANFFAYSDDEVWPRVPILARVARAVRLEVDP